MPWFRQKVYGVVHVEADNVDEANERLEEIWPANQPRGFSFDLWSDNGPEDGLEEEDE